MATHAVREAERRAREPYSYPYTVLYILIQGARGPPQDIRAVTRAQTLSTAGAKTPTADLGPRGLGTAPVFLASISTVLGAIMFLRFGYAVAHVGLVYTIVIIVHGLGGSATSYYARKAAVAAAEAGLDSLRLNLRGADRGGGDYYHAGLIEDLAAAIRRSPRRAEAVPIIFRGVYIFRYGPAITSENCFLMTYDPHTARASPGSYACAEEILKNRKMILDLQAEDRQLRQELTEIRNCLTLASVHI